MFKIFLNAVPFNFSPKIVCIQWNGQGDFIYNWFAINTLLWIEDEMFMWTTSAIFVTASKRVDDWLTNVLWLSLKYHVTMRVIAASVHVFLLNHVLMNYHAPHLADLFIELICSLGADGIIWQNKYCTYEFNWFWRNIVMEFSASDKG